MTPSQRQCALARRTRWTRSRSAGWARRSTDPAAATTRSTGSRSTRPTEQGLLDRPVEFVLHAENGLPQGSAKNATDGFRYLVDEGLHRRRRRVQLRQRDHRRAARERAAGAAHQLVRHRAAAGRLLLPARQRRLRRRRRARRRVAEAQRPRARRGAERDLPERRGVLPLLPPGVPAPRHQHRRGRDGEPEPREPRDQPRQPAPGRTPTRSSTWATGCSPRRGCCATRSTSSTGTRRASWAPRSCSI